MQLFGADLAVPERIRAYWTDLTISSRRVATVVLEHPRAALELTIGELAERAGTSPATVTRFCRQLGYPGYTALRLTTAADLGSGRSSPGPAAAAASSAEVAVATSTVEKAQERLLARAVKDLQHVSTAIDLQQLEVIASLVVRSRHVDIYGVGLSAADAAHLAARLQRLGVLCNAWTDLHAGLVSAAAQHDDCLAIAFSRTGRSKETLQMLRRAGVGGAATVAITTSRTSPLARSADKVIQTPPPGGAEDLQAHHSALLVADLICELSVQVAEDRSSASSDVSAEE